MISHHQQHWHQRLPPARPQPPGYRAPAAPPSGNKLVLAKAQYDNAGDSKDELTFYRGDILTVLEEEPNGLTGWWLCMFNGRRGIVPGNRLQVLSSYPACTTPPGGGATGSTNGAGGAEGMYQTPANQNAGAGAGVNWNRRSWHMHPNKGMGVQTPIRPYSSPVTSVGVKVVTPQKMGGIYIYDQPNHGYQDYDVPPSRYFPANGQQLNGDGIPGRFSGDGAPNALYDTPNAARVAASRGTTGGGDPTDLYDVPPSAHAHIPIGSLSTSNRSSTTSVLSTGSTATMSSNSSSGPSGRLVGGSNPTSACGSARSSTEVQDIYDVPPPAKAVNGKSPLTLKQGSISADGSCPHAITAARVLIEDYDFPLKRTSPFRDTDSGIVTNLREEGLYDMSGNNIQNNKVERDNDNIYDHPPNNAPTGAWVQGRVQGLSVGGGGVHDGSVYDIPPQVTRDSAISMRSDCSSLMDDISSRLSSCSVASSGGSSDVPPIPYDELPLDLDSALELLVKLQQEVHSATTRLLSFVHTGWREKEQLEPKLYNIKLGCLGVQATLQEFVDFGQGALANSTKADDKKLVKKLNQLLEPLQESLKTVNKSLKHLNGLSWSISELICAGSNLGTDVDALGSIANLARDVPGIVRIMASCIQGNSTLLFKRQQILEGYSAMNVSSPSPKKVPPPVRPKPPVPKPPVLPKPKPPQRDVSLERRTSMQDRPLPAPPLQPDALSPIGNHDPSSAVYEVPHGDEDPQEKDNKDNNKEAFLEDYDYVHLENRPVLAADSSGVDGTAEDETDSGIVANDAGLTPTFQERLQQIKGIEGECIVGTQDNNNVSKIKVPVLHQNDKQLLAFYAGQISTHTTQLVAVIDGFFQCIEYNQPPKVFIAHSKSVIMAAHRMVYICDTIHRNLLNDEVRVKVMACANYLCDCLKLTVIATKSAALQYPSVVTVQEMVDRIVDISHSANEIKLVVTQAAIL